MVDKQKTLHALESGVSDRYLSVVRAGNPTRGPRAQGTIPSNNAQFESGGAKSIGQAGGAGAELLTGGASQKPVEIVVPEPIGQFAAAVGRREHHHPSQIRN